MQIFHNKLGRGREEWEGGERVKIWQWLSSAFAFAVDFGGHEYRKRVQEEGEREKQKERERGKGGERENQRQGGERVVANSSLAKQRPKV